MARWIVAGRVVAEGRKRSKARFTVAVRVARNLSSSNMGCCFRQLAFWVQAFCVGVGWRRALRVKIRNPKDRRPKEGRNPKSEIRKATALEVGSQICHLLRFRRSGW